MDGVNEMKSFVCEVVILFGALTLGFALLLVAASELDSKTCADKAEIMELNHSYGFWTGCMYEVNGRFVADEMLRAVDMLGDE